MIEIPGVSARAALPRIQYVLNAEGLTMPDAQVLFYLQEVEHMMDLRKYFKTADELLYLHRNGGRFPRWKAAAPTLTVV